jgi:hypothetical protein
LDYIFQVSKLAVALRQNTGQDFSPFQGQQIADGDHHALKMAAAGRKSGKSEKDPDL